VVLVTEFESQDALAAYATHPEHIRVRHELGNIRTARYQVDYRVGQVISSTKVGEAACGKA
jgi:heme-degrading monooxygenase HmoA